MPSQPRYPAEGLVPYDTNWAHRYAEIAATLQDALGDGWSIEHVGSTSVPEMLAKPVIDVAVGVPSGEQFDRTVEVLRQLSWTGPNVVGDHQTMLYLVDGVRTAITHLFTAEQWPEAHLRLFADWLRSHPPARDEYVRIKTGLVSDGIWGHDYTRAKAVFVQDTVNHARAARGLAPIELIAWPGP